MAPRLVQPSLLGPGRQHDHPPHPRASPIARVAEVRYLIYVKAETLNRASAWDMPYAAPCAASSIKGSTAKVQRTGGGRRPPASCCIGQTVSRSREKAPRNARSPITRRTRNGWSGECALCTRRAELRFDGGGAGFEPAPDRPLLRVMGPIRTVEGLRRPPNPKFTLTWDSANHMRLTRTDRPSDRDWADPWDIRGIAA